MNGRDRTAMSLKEFKINLNPEKPKKCIHCKKKFGEHQAGTNHCPNGPYTRIGQIGFDKEKVFTPKEK